MTRVRRGVRGFLGAADDQSDSIEEEEDDGFSYIKCCQSTERCKRDDLFKALRTAVLDDVQEFKDKAWKDKEVIECPLSHVMTRKGDSDIDHCGPFQFRDIVRMFVAQINDDVSKLATRASTKGIGTCELVDEEVANRFREFHKEKAQLRVVNKVKKTFLENNLWGNDFFFFF